MIIRTSAGQLFQVREAGEEMPHAWIGIEVRAIAGRFVSRAKPREILVRKAATTIVQH